MGSARVAVVAVSNFQAITNRLDVGFETEENPSGSKSKQLGTANDKLMPLTQLFSYADKTDILLMIIGTIGALAAGLSQPIQIVLFGEMINSFNPAVGQPPGEFRAAINRVSLKFVILGGAVIVCCFLQVACWSRTASRQAKRIRSAYGDAILSKEIGWFDEGMGRKVGDGLQFASMAISGVIIGLVKGWQLALLLFAFTSVIALTAFLSIKVLSSATQAGIDSYSKAGAIAQESLSNIRTLHMLQCDRSFRQEIRRSARVLDHGRYQ